MITRYTRPEMGSVWEPQTKFQCMLEVELAVAAAQAELGIIPASAADAIRGKAQFSVSRILEIEQTTKHDVIAFVSNVAENVGEAGRYVHYGLTSSDVLDTAMSLQVRRACDVLLKSHDRLVGALKKKINEHKLTWMAGRTHGIHAEPTTFGLKLAGHVAELKRARMRIEQACQQMMIGKLSGAVGTYSAQPEQVELNVCRMLKLTPETVATQVIPRDRHAQLISALALAGTAIERLAIELRHLQRTEVGEVIEGFDPGQKGSSAMPHKKNPISSENLTGLARLLRGYAQAALEDVALWHERDISHSSVERVIFPDAFILTDYAFDRMSQVIDKLYVDRDRMKRNMEASQGQLFSSHVLLALVDKGLSREDAYKLVQSVAHGMKPGQQMKTELLANPDVAGLLNGQELDQIFSGARHQQAIERLIARVLN